MFIIIIVVSELTSSLEESQDELQVLKRKNTAHIKVSDTPSFFKHDRTTLKHSLLMYQNAAKEVITNPTLTQYQITHDYKTEIY